MDGYDGTCQHLSGPKLHTHHFSLYSGPFSCSQSPPRPGRSGLSLQRTGMMAMLHTLLGRYSRVALFF